MISENKYHGLFEKDGSFHLLAYCGKWGPLVRMRSTNTGSEQKQKSKAA